MGTDDEPFGGPPPDPSLRAWRHPSEVAAAARAAARDQVEPTPAFSAKAFALGGAAGVAVCVGLIMFTSLASFGPPSDRSSVDVVALPPPATASLNASDTPAGIDTSIVAESDSANWFDPTGDLEAALTGSSTELAPTTTAAAGALTTLVVSAAGANGASLGSESNFDPETYGSQLPAGVYAVINDGELVAHAVAADGLLFTSARAISSARMARADALAIQVEGRQLAVSTGASDPYSDVGLLALETSEPLTEIATGATSTGSETGASVTAGTTVGEIVTNNYRTVGKDGHPVIGTMLTTIVSTPADAGSLLLSEGGIPLGFIVDCDSKLTTAVPLDTARRIASDLADVGVPRSAWLGIDTSRGADGLVLSSVQADAPASDAGLLEGDILVSVNDTPLQDLADLVHLLRAARVEETLTIEVLRGTHLIEISVAVSVRP